MNRILIYLVLMKTVKNILTNRPKKGSADNFYRTLNTVMDIIQATINNK